MEIKSSLLVIKIQLFMVLGILGYIVGEVSH